MYVKTGLLLPPRTNANKPAENALSSSDGGGAAGWVRGAVAPTNVLSTKHCTTLALPPDWFGVRRNDLQASRVRSRRCAPTVDCGVSLVLILNEFNKCACKRDHAHARARMLLCEKTS